MRFTIIPTKHGNQPPQISYDFYAPGGTIGRATDNDLVLPDNNRIISRLQIIVHVDAQGECRITNCGSGTHVVLNDIPLERGGLVELQDGDILSIDDYRIKVTGLIQNTQQIASMMVSMQQQSRLEMEPASAVEMKQVSTLSHSNADTTNVPLEIWDNLMHEFSVSDSISNNQTKQQQTASHDPFSQPAVPERNTENPLTIFNGSNPKLEHKNVNSDTLFSDDALFKKVSIFDDVTPSVLTPQEENTSSLPIEEETDVFDPLALFGNTVRASSSRNDDLLGLIGDVSLIHTDEVIIEKIEQKEDAIASYLLLAPEYQDESRTEDEGLVRRDRADLTMPTSEAIARNCAQPPKGRVSIDSAKNVTSSVVTAQQREKGEVLQGELLEALLKGLGLNEMQPVPQFDRENMHQLGHILSMFSQSTVALLSSRSIFKRSVKTDMTMVLDDVNNPFKLLPTGKTVLIQMFCTPMPGFMLPIKSVRDALIDLQAHQLGMISGIRAIIASMLKSFNPEQLEDKARLSGITSRLSLPGSRKAALWDYFVRSYGETVGEIEDDFHSLFGEAFLNAYDMEVNQYKDSLRDSEEQ